MGRLDEAVAACDAAITILTDLVEQGRAELAGELAEALGNKGGALAQLGRLDEAVAAYDAAIAIRRELVEQGRAELAATRALMSKGDALDGSGRLDEAVTACDEAIAILPRAGRARPRRAGRRPGQSPDEQGQRARRTGPAR